MLKVLAIFGVLASVLINGAWSQVPRDRSEHQQHPESKDSKSQPPSQPCVCSVQVQESSAKPAQDSERKSPDYPWKELLAPANVPNWFLFLAAIWAGWMALGTLDEIRDQASAQMDADRAWVVIQGIGNPELRLAYQQSGYVPGIVYQMQIYGNTPARIGRERFRCRIVPAIPGSKPPQPQLESIPVYTSELSRFNGSVSPPGYSYRQSVPLESGPTTEQELLDLQDGKTLLCSYCCIEYVDIFGRTAVTQTCLVYDFAFGGVVQSPDGTILNPPGFRPGGPDTYRRTT